MTQVAKKTAKNISYIVALAVGFVLIAFGIQSKNDSSAVTTGEDVQNPFGETVYADHGDGGDGNPWGGNGGFGGNNFSGDDGGDDDGT